MTESEYHSLSNSTLYEFSLYHGKTEYGYLSKDFGSNLYYIKMPTNDKKKASETGYPVYLNQIANYKPIESNKIPSYDILTINGAPKAKKMVIFGAGASHDFTFDTSIEKKGRPPLAQNLFDDQYSQILNYYHGANNLSGEIIRTDNIEKYFQEQWLQINKYHDPSLLNKLINTQYYLHHLFMELSDTLKNNRKNNYNTLVKHVNDYIIQKQNKEHVIFVSFNYDTLIEEALKNTIGYEFLHTENYIDNQNRNILLFKPHGSSNWVKRFNMNFTTAEVTKKLTSSIYDVPRYIYENNIDLSRINNHLEKDITVLSRHTTINQNDPRGRWYYYPWLLIPYSDKDEFVMPTKHEHTMKYLLKDIDEILIIGWKGTESAFQNMLYQNVGQKQIKVTYVNYKDDSIKEVLKDTLPQAEWVDFREKSNTSGTFSDFVSYCIKNRDYLFG